MRGRDAVEPVCLSVTSCQFTHTWSLLTGGLLTLSGHFVSASETAHFSFLLLTACSLRILLNTCPPFSLVSLPSLSASFFVASPFYSLLPFPPFFSAFCFATTSLNLGGDHGKTNSSCKRGAQPQLGKDLGKQAVRDLRRKPRKMGFAVRSVLQ